MHDNNWARAAQSFNGVSRAMNGEIPEISYYILESPEVMCDYGEVNSLELSNHYYPEISWSDRVFTLSLDVTEYRDGWHDILLVSRDLLTALTSMNCVSMRVDNSPPTVSIQGPAEVTEGFSGAIFDGSGTDDAFWGMSGLLYIWSINEISGGVRNNIHVLSGDDERVISLDTNSSGDFEITLTAIDKAGNSATDRRVFTVNNLAPVVRLLIDGEPFFEGDEFYLPSKSTCLIDGSESSDTENDMDSLRYVWRVNNVPVYEGSGRELSWPDDVGSEFLLTLEVIDDNAHSSMISVRVLDDDSENSFPSQLIILVISAAFLGYAIIKSTSRRDSESDIPKWV